MASARDRCLQFLDELKQSGLTEAEDQQNRLGLDQNAQHIDNLASGIYILKLTGLGSHPHYRTLLQCLPHADTVAYGLFLLSDDNLLTQENHTALLQNAPYAKELAEGFRTLNNENLLTSEENRRALIQNAPYATELAKGFKILNKENLLTPENRAALLRNGPHRASRFARNLIQLLFIEQLRSSSLSSGRSVHHSVDQFPYFYGRNSIRTVGSSRSNTQIPSMNTEALYDIPAASDTNPSVVESETESQLNRLG